MLRISTVHSLHTCMYVYIYIYTHVYIYIYIYIYVCVCAYVYTYYIYTCLWMASSSYDSWNANQSRTAGLYYFAGGMAGCVFFGGACLYTGTVEDFLQSLNPGTVSPSPKSQCL